MFRHPKYYKELRKRALDERNRERVIICSAAPNTDQVISPTRATAPSRRAPGPGPKRQAVYLKINLKRVRKQYTSDKHQATSSQATSDKRQAPSSKRQA